MRTSIAVATYFCMWFLTLFAVLPFFAKTQDEHGTTLPGTPASAPAKINMWKVAAVNTVVSTLAFSLLYASTPFFPAIYRFVTALYGME